MTDTGEMILTEDDLKFIDEQAEYFDTHDLSEELKNRPEVPFEILGTRSHYYFEVEPELRTRLKAIAKQRGVSAEALLNQWLREKIAEIETPDTAK